MSFNGTRKNLAYGFNNPLQSLAPQPIIANRAPLSSDIGEISQQWIYNNVVYVFTSKSTWTQLASQSGTGSFSSLSVSGASVLTGGITSSKVTSASTTVTNSSFIGSTTITGLTTASAASFTVTMTNTNVTTASSVIVTASNLNASTNAARVAVTGVVTAANTIIITVTNNGAGALGTGDNVHIGHIVLN